METVPMYFYLIVSTIMFFCGIYGFITRKSLIAMLISTELMLNACDLNFAIFNRFLYPENMEGMIFTMFSIAISAAETAVAIAIFINIYRNIANVETENLNQLKD